MLELILKPSINGADQVSVRDAYPLGRGGEAIIYAAELGGKVYAAKIFHDALNVDIRKIQAMLNNPPSQMSQQVAGATYPMYSWPLGILYDKKSRPVGFLMPLIDLKQSFTLDYYYDQGLIGKLNSVNEYALSYRVEIAMHLSEMVADLHEHQHYFIDMKPQNIRVFKTTHAVTLIDCDGFSVFDPASNQRFPATMYSSDYIAPEVLKQNSPATKLGEEQDLYALATIIFQLFNWGIHPFQGIVKPGLGDFDTNDEKAKALLYPHGLIPHPQIKPRAQSVHSCFDDVTRQMFDQAFIGVASARPKARQWADHLRNLYESRQLAKCPTFPNDIKHMRWAGKDCPQCYLDKSIKSTSIAKFKPIATPKSVSISSYTPRPINQVSVVQKKKFDWRWGWIGALVVGVAVTVIRDKTDSSPPTSIYTAPTNYYTRLWFNPKTTQIGVYSSTISHAHADTMASKACGVGCVLNTNPVADLRCLSVAQSRNGPGKVNFSAATDMNSAKQTALNNCNQNYGDCYTPSNGSHCAD
jgi:serine/threonine protein kinase